MEQVNSELLDEEFQTTDCSISNSSAKQQTFLCCYLAVFFGGVKTTRYAA